MSKFKALFVAIVSGSALFLVVLGFIYPHLGRGESKSITLSASQVEVEKGAQFTVRIFVNADTAPMKKANITLSYPSDLVAITDFVPGDVLPEQTGWSGYDNERGLFAWGAFTDEAATSTGGEFGVVTFEALEEGLARIQTTSSSQLVGEAGAMTITFGSATVSVGKKGVRAPEEMDLPDIPVEAGVESIPSVTTPTALSPKSTTVSPVSATTRVLKQPIKSTIKDADPPINLVIAPTQSLISDRAAFVITAQDVLSGIDHYMVSVDRGRAVYWRPQDSRYVFHTPILTPGERLLSVVAYDRAGNFSRKQVAFTIASYEKTGGMSQGMPIILSERLEGQQGVVRSIDAPSMAWWSVLSVGGIAALGALIMTLPALLDMLYVCECGRTARHLKVRHFYRSSVKPIRRRR